MATSTTFNLFEGLRSVLPGMIIKLRLPVYVRLLLRMASSKWLHMWKFRFWMSLRICAFLTNVRFLVNESGIDLDCLDIREKHNRLAALPFTSNILQFNLVRGSWIVTWSVDKLKTVVCIGSWWTEYLCPRLPLGGDGRGQLSNPGLFRWIHVIQCSAPRLLRSPFGQQLYVLYSGRWSSRVVFQFERISGF